MRKISDAEIILALDGNTVAECAEKFGVSRQAIYSRMEKKSFKEAKRRHERSIYQGISASLQMSARKAIACLNEILADKEAGSGAKCRACGILLEYALKYRESVDFAERLERLEALADGDK